MDFKNQTHDRRVRLLIQVALLNCDVVANDEPMRGQFEALRKNTAGVLLEIDEDDDSWDLAACFNEPRRRRRRRYCDSDATCMCDAGQRLANCSR